MTQEKPQSIPELPIFGDDIHAPQELSNIIADIYAAALDHSRWVGAIERTTRFIGGTGAALYCKNVANQEDSVKCVTGINPFFIQFYFDSYFTLHPTGDGQLLAEAEQPFVTADLVSHPEFMETPFYREWAQPHGIVDCVNAVLEKSTTSLAVFAVFRSERDGVVDHQAQHRMRLISPHIRRAILIRRMFDLKIAEAATFAETLDGLDVGMCLVDTEGHIVHANSAGHDIISVGGILRSIGGRLVACDSKVDKSLREVFSGEHDASPRTTGMAVPMISKDDERYIAHVLPLNSGSYHRAGGIYKAAAALFVRKAAFEVSPSSEIIGKTFKLTPTELRVLLAIVEVGGVPEVAALLGVAATTIKTHLGRLFEKTGTKRQTDLVKLVAGYTMPVTS